MTAGGGVDHGSLAVWGSLGDNDGMIEVTEPQVWTAVSVLSASFVAMVTVVPWLFVRVLRAEIGTVRTEIRALDEKFTVKFDHLDRDVQAVVRKVFPTDP